MQNESTKTCMYLTRDRNACTSRGRPRFQFYPAEIFRRRKPSMTLPYRFGGAISSRKKQRSSANTVQQRYLQSVYLDRGLRKFPGKQVDYVTTSARMLDVRKRTRLFLEGSGGLPQIRKWYFQDAGFDRDLRIYPGTRTNDITASIRIRNVR